MIPFFGDLLNLAGALTVTATSFLLPFSFYLKYFWKTLSKIEIVLLFVLLLGGAFITVSGTIVAVSSIMENMGSYTLF